MIALAVALTALCAASTAGLITFGVWYRSSQRELGNARDRLDALGIVIDTVTDERNVASAGRKIAEDQLAQERHLRVIAETQRNTAQERVRDLLRTHIAKATNEEIQELTNEAFTTPLALAPRAPRSAGVPPQMPRRSEAGPDALIDPFADLQPSKAP